MYWPVLPECAPRLPSPCHLQAPNAWSDSHYRPPCGPIPPPLPKGCWRAEALTGSWCIPNSCPKPTLLISMCQPGVNGMYFFECPIEECIDPKEKCCDAGDTACQQECRDHYGIAVDCPVCEDSNTFPAIPTPTATTSDSTAETTTTEG